MPNLKKPKKIIGNNLIFRDAAEDDAEFILGLRTNKQKSRYLTTTSNRLSDQIDWLKSYQLASDQVYFVIEDKNNERVGTVRVYDVIESSFCWGSWILKDGVLSSFAIESALLTYHFALSLGFNSAHFNVRRCNHSVCKFHENFGAMRVAEDSENIAYTISLDAIESSLRKFKRYLPNPCLIEY